MPLKISLALLILFFTLDSNAQQIKEQTIDSEIESLIVYLDGAEVTRKKSVNLKRGRNRLVFTGLSPKINPRNIQVSTTGEVAVLSISHKNNFLTKVEEKPRITALRDSLELVDEALTLLADDKDAYTIEKGMLLENQSIGGQDNGVPVAALKEASDFYRLRVREINKKVSTINRKMKKIAEAKGRIERELISLNASNSYTGGEISILVSAPSDMASGIDLRYLVASRTCGWVATYDIKAEDSGKDIELVYRAKVFNNTGLDWNHVKMKLSTGDPSLSASQPKLEPWYLSYSSRGRNNAVQGYTQDLNTDYGYNAHATGDGAGGTITYEHIEVPQLSAEFDIKTPYSIPSDATPYLVEVDEFTLPATYKHFAVPVTDHDVFLLARITGWEDLNLVEGYANIYYSSTYVGQSYIQTHNTNDTLDISLGRDKKVLVTRVKQKDFSSKKLIGSNRKEVHSYKIVMKNNRAEAIEVDLLDQVPVSQDSDIEVSIMETSDAEENELTGELKWHFNITPGQTKEVILTFAIKYPKSKPIATKQVKGKMRAMF
jgi:uncharacterized protein (TIGR02231 family)